MEKKPRQTRLRLVTTDETCPNCGAPAVKLIFRGRRPRMICVNMGCGARRGPAAGKAPEKPEGGAKPASKPQVRVKVSVKVRKSPANSCCASSGKPQAMLPMATPISRLDPMLPAAKPTSHICRHQPIGCLLRNSMATARKINDTSRSTNAK